MLGRACLRTAAVASAVALAGCGLLGGRAALRQGNSQVMTVTSPEFGQGRAIPRQYTCRDRHETPPVSWSGVPPDTKALALVVDDTDAPITPYVYWIVFDINPEITDIQANHLPPGALQAVNSRGTVGYAAAGGGPQLSTTLRPDRGRMAWGRLIPSSTAVARQRARWLS